MRSIDPVNKTINTVIITTNPQDLCLPLTQGAVIAYPTEAVFGLGCHPLNETAVRRLLLLKKRAIKKGLILIASDFSQVASFLLPLSTQQQQYTQASETTWVFPASPHAPQWVTGQYNSVAIRITQHPPIQQLCQLFNTALVSTSANISGQDPAQNTQAVISQFNHQLDGILDAPVGHLSKPTEIRDGLTGQIIRA